MSTIHALHPNQPQIGPPHPAPAHLPRAVANRAVDSAAAQHARWAARFGRVVAAGGVAAIPQALFYYQGALGLQAQEVWFVCCILADRWDGALPHTSLAQLAQRSLLSGSQVRRIKLGLEQQGALRTLPRHDAASASQLANDYDFAGLFGRLERLVAADPPPANAIRDEDAPAWRRTRQCSPGTGASSRATGACWSVTG